jgi:uncharacterized membrane protein HdeD (DUF308 family)
MKALGGKSLIAIGALHCSVGLAFGLDTLAQIVSDGFVNAVEPHVGRMYWFWFMVTGVLMIVVGQLTHSIERRRDTLPGYLGWEILALGVFATAAIPVSGGWLVIGAGIYLLLKGRQKVGQRGQRGAV